MPIFSGPHECSPFGAEASKRAFNNPEARDLARSITKLAEGKTIRTVADALIIVGDFLEVERREAADACTVWKDHDG